MAELKLSTVWQIKDFVERVARLTNTNEACEFESKELTALRHSSLPGLTWLASLSISPNSSCARGSAGFYLNAYFGTSEADAEYAIANVNASLCDESGEVVAVYKFGRFTAFSHPPSGFYFDYWGDNDAFSKADLHKAVSKAGSLSIRIDLTILDMAELFNCRELLRGLLANKTHADFDVKVGDESFKLHKSVLAETSTVFAAVFESGMEEAADGALTLADTTPAAFTAFTQAIYYDFLSDVDLTQEVLHLAEKYDVANLKRCCDDTLAAKISEANALEILTKSAALCNAEKTKTACMEILAEHMEFKESQTWKDFKKRNRGVALEILDVVSDKWIATIASLKRQCEEEKEKAACSKRRRKMDASQIQHVERKSST